MSIRFGDEEKRKLGALVGVISAIIGISSFVTGRSKLSDYTSISSSNGSSPTPMAMDWAEGKFFIKTDTGWHSFKLLDPVTRLNNVGLRLTYSADQWPGDFHTYESNNLYFFVRQGKVVGMFSGIGGGGGLVAGAAEIGKDETLLESQIGTPVQSFSPKPDQKIDFDALFTFSQKQTTLYVMVNNAKVTGLAIENEHIKDSFPKYYGG